MYPSDTTTNLEEQLKSLKSTLLDLESEEEGLILEQQQLKQEVSEHTLLERNKFLT